MTSAVRSPRGRDKGRPGSGTLQKSPFSLGPVALGLLVFEGLLGSVGSLTARPPSEDGSATVHAPDCPAPVVICVCFPLPAPNHQSCFNVPAWTQLRGDQGRDQSGPKHCRVTVVVGAGESPQDKGYHRTGLPLEARLSNPIGGGSSGQVHSFSTCSLSTCYVPACSGGEILMPPALREKYHAL